MYSYNADASLNAWVFHTELGEHSPNQWEGIFVVLVVVQMFKDINKTAIGLQSNTKHLSDFHAVPYLA